MGNGIGVVVAGNEYNKVDTIKVLARTVAGSDELMGQVVGKGMLDNAESIANSPAYGEAVEVLALYLMKMVEGYEDEQSLLKDDGEEDDDDLEEDDEEDDDEDEEDSEGKTEICAECGEVLSLDDGKYLGGRFICDACLYDAVNMLD